MPILMAEDYEPHAALFQLVLKKAGVANQVIVVRDGDEAIAYLGGDGMYADRQKFPLPGVLLLDLKMPRVDGFTVLEWCKKQPHLKKLLIVVLSGHGEMRKINAAYALGAHSFLTKPCHLLDILNLTKNFTGYWDVQPPGEDHNHPLPPWPVEP